jgi:stage II sporulation protein D
VVNGYQARTRLGLKDTLYSLSRSRADDGSVASFTFDGRGWGHGIGLCQTGAVGMAQAGRTAEEILKTYYQGVELRKVY